MFFLLVRGKEGKAWQAASCAVCPAGVPDGGDAPRHAASRVLIILPYAVIIAIQACDDNGEAGR